MSDPFSSTFLGSNVTMDPEKRKEAALEFLTKLWRHLDDGLSEDIIKLLQPHLSSFQLLLQALFQPQQLLLLRLR